MIIVAFIAPTLEAQENRDLWPLSTFIQSAKIHYMHVYKKGKERKELYVCIELMQDAARRFKDDRVPEIYFTIGTFYAEISAYDTMVAYFDTTAMYCNDETVDKKHRKKCKDFQKKIDDMRERDWQITYNDGAEFLAQYDTIVARLAKTTTEDSLTLLDSLRQVAFDLSANDFKNAAILKPQDPRAFTNLGVLQEREKRYAEAIDYYKQAMAIKGEDGDMVGIIANAHIAREDRSWDSVIVWYEKLLEYKPDDIGALINLSIAHGVQGNADKAYEYNVMVIEKAPNNAQALFNAGQSWFIRMQDANSEMMEYPDSIPDNKTKRQEIEKEIILCRDSAIYYLTKSLEVDSQDIDALRQIGILYLFSGTDEGNQKAAESFARIVEIDPENTDALDYLGRAYIMQGQFDLAIKPYEKIVDSNPGNCEAWETLAELYQYTDQAAKAQEAATKAEECNEL